MKVSRGFLSALLGIAMTLLAWYGPWEWPAWPAFAAIRIAFGTHSEFAEQPYAVRAGWVVGLIAVNVAAWATFTWSIWTAVRRIRRRASS